MKVSGWGRYPVVDAAMVAPRGEKALQEAVADRRVIARGNGRAYGDCAVNPERTVHMRHFNRLIAFDAASGQLVAESGVLLADIIETFLPRGWFPFVTPGTKFVTLGGMLAADVHGKNHHIDGSIGRFVDWLDVLTANGQIERCSADRNRDLFEWTIGGMGLTGIILRAAIRLRPIESGWIRQTTIPAATLDAAMELFEKSADATYSVAWIDGLGQQSASGRSLVMLGEHANRGDLPLDRRDTPFQTPRRRALSVPFDAPSGLLNRYTARAFNQLYYWAGRRNAGTRLIDWDRFFYPLDALLGWNRIYGRKGLAQFQCVLPLEQSRVGIQALLDTVSGSGSGAFLAVLKKFGDQQGRFSFPMPGYTLALDFPISPASLALLDKLDAITLDHGGRFYLAKDARMSARTLHAADLRAASFARLRQEQGHDRYQSSQSRRLAL